MPVTHFSKSPSDLTITPRDRRFGRGEVQKRWWLDGRPVATSFYNALSITFPKGEAFFIESVKAFREGTPQRLDSEIRAFIQQEVMHSREHVAFNKRVADAGYDTSRLEEAVTSTLAMIQGRSPFLNLAVTMALEHYTAIMAQQMLTNPKIFAGADAEQINLWHWHAIEEIEHKGVAYDTWLHATRDWSRWKRWRVKSIMMLLVTSRFWPKRIRGMLDLLRQDGLSGPIVWVQIAWFLLGSPGTLRTIFFSVAGFLLARLSPVES
jgi:uncharacterized protein